MNLKSIKKINAAYGRLLSAGSRKVPEYIEMVETSEFIFRMMEDRSITCALFEADGGAWKNAAMQNIKNYLEFELADYKDQFTVIS